MWWRIEYVSEISKDFSETNFLRINCLFESVLWKTRNKMSPFGNRAVSRLLHFCRFHFPLLFLQTSYRLVSYFAIHVAMRSYSLTRLIKGSGKIRQGKCGRKFVVLVRSPHMTWSAVTFRGVRFFFVFEKKRTLPKFAKIYKNFWEKLNFPNIREIFSFFKVWETSLTSPHLWNLFTSDVTVHIILIQ